MTLLRRPSWAKRPPREWDGDGFDTETYRGWARLLCTSEKSLLVKRGDFNAIAHFLLDAGPRLCAWNLRFDAEAILKHLPEATLRRLYAVESVNVGALTIEILPWKLLRVTDGDRSCEIFDIAPFFGGKLDTAARRFLGEGKLTVDAGALNTSPEAWRGATNLRRIVEYCQRDARLTNELAKLVSARFVKLGGDFRRPYSVAFVAADILMRDARIPALQQDIQPIAEDAFRGARFECVWRGRFPDACAYDIKSAYPAGLRLVEAAERGRWVESRRPHKDALHALVRARVHVPPDDYPILAPLPHKRSDTVVYPVGSFETTLLLESYRRFEHLCTPVESWSFIPDGPTTFPYRTVVDRLLAYREESDALLKDSAKRGNNSLYGKLLNQRTEFRLHVDDGGSHWTHDRVLIDGTPYRRERVRKKGLLYNPLHAGIVTEATRLAIWDVIAKHPEKVLMIQADGLLTDGPVLGLDKAKKAGDLGFVARGDSIVCGSGLYEIRGYARRTRGVMFHATNEAKGGGKKRLKGASWFGLLRGKRAETVVFRDVRPAHIGESLRGGSVVDLGTDGVRSLGLKDANVFLPFERTLNVCRDKKREWPDIREARRLLRERFLSRPLKMNQNSDPLATNGR